MDLKTAVLERLKKLSWLTKLWWGTGLFFLLATAVTDSSDSCLGFFLTTLFVLWVVPTLLWGLFWLWVKITYRIGVRLFFSYLLIGVLPFPLILGILAFAGYILIGQYASAELGDFIKGAHTQVVRLVEDTLDAAVREGDEAARERLERGPELTAEQERLRGHVDWFFANGGEVTYSAGSPRIRVPDWIEADSLNSAPFWYGDSQWLMAYGRRGDRIAAAYVRLTGEVAGALSEDHWYQVTFVEDDDVQVASDDGLELDAEEEIQRKEEETAAQEEAPDAGFELKEGEGLWSSTWNARWIWFVRVGPELRRWSSGEVIEGKEFLTLLNTSPREAATDLFQAPYEVREVLLHVFLGMCLFFFLVYAGVVSLAAYQIWTITRSTARLTHGTRQVEGGNLDYRIPVKRRDQLGDLAVAFNRMTESVGSMIDEVAENERLKNELELAREIQQSLLPDPELRHGSIAVHAYFRPAAEVGGDYFDLFPLERGRLIVAAGDVAGHGLPTGLLMAMVKSAVATLIREGHRGPAILERVNQFMLQQPREHRMVTLAIADINVESRVAEITNAAHPPVFLSRGTVREVLLPALPVGYQWRKPPPTKTLKLDEGSRLVFYSDGLVEAVNPEEEQFGYERLRAFLEDNAEMGSDELLAQLLKELENHTAGRPLDDDLTILVIDCGVSGS